MTLNSYDEHPKQRSQFLSSIASDLSAPAAPESLDATHMTSSSKNSRGTVYSTSSYSSKAVHVGFSTGGTHISGCFFWRTSTTGCPVFVQMSPGRRTPPPPYLLVTRRTTCRRFPGSTVLWKLCARRSSSSSTCLLTRPSRALPYAKAPPTRPVCIPLSQSSSRQLILDRISLALQVPSVLVNTTWGNMRGLSEFNFRSSTPCHYADLTALNRCPTARSTR